MAPARKLFLTHAGELAHRLVTAIARNGMAIEFVRAYGERHHRPKIAANAERLREMESTISREALLLVAADVRRLLPQAFGSSHGSGSQGFELCDLFYREFLDSLGRALEWPSVEAEAESEAFGKDLAIYARWRERNTTLSAKSLRSANDAPFPDRCAILLDPAMMEQARRAATLFQTDLLRIGARIFGRLGRQVSRRPEPSGAQARSASVRARKGPATTPAKRPRSARKPTNRAKPPRRRR
jgi:hypothetical protein